MIPYYLMATLLLLALAAIKIDGWLSAFLLIIAMLLASPGVKFPIKYLKALLVTGLCLLALLAFPDIEGYREAFENSLQTEALPSPELKP